MHKGRRHIEYARATILLRYFILSETKGETRRQMNHWPHHKVKIARSRPQGSSLDYDPKLAPGVYSLDDYSAFWLMLDGFHLSVILIDRSA